MKYCVRLLSGALLAILFFPVFFISSCVKSADDPRVPDSLYVINKLDIYLGNDSTQWTVSTKNSFDYDTIKRLTTQTITEGSFGDPHPYTCQNTYQYDSQNRLSDIHFGRDSYVYTGMHFDYNADGTLQKGLFSRSGNIILENSFTASTSNGNTIITQYDTLTANIGRGDYFSSRPAIIKYTFDNTGNLISKYVIGSELYNGQPAYSDTSETRYSYDGNNHLLQTIQYSVATDNQGNYVHSKDSTQFKRDNSGATPVNDLALAVLRNLHWLITTDNVNLFTGLYAVNYGLIYRNEPLLTTFEDNGISNYAAGYTNDFNAEGLLAKSSATTTEHNIYNNGNTTRETHYYSYLKLKK